MKLFEQEGIRPTPHTLTDEEQRNLAGAFASLTPLHKRILKERLRSVSFLDGMPNTALTSTINPDEPYKLFDITIRAAILHQTASEWLTEKERTMFNANGSEVSVSIDAGKKDALLFALLHEATHVVDACLRITPDHTKPVPPTLFTQGVWTDRTTPASAYRDPLRERIRFRPGGEVLPIDQAAAVYRSLQQTPFVSLYGSSNWYDDLCEFVAAYHWTAKLHQPYRIVVRSGNHPILMFEPLKRKIVMKRAGQLKPFYEQRERDAITIDEVMPW